jgi:hypothetical protein
MTMSNTNEENNNNNSTSSSNSNGDIIIIIILIINNNNNNNNKNNVIKLQTLSERQHDIWGCPLKCHFVYVVSYTDGTELMSHCLVHVSSSGNTPLV